MKTTLDDVLKAADAYRMANVNGASAHGARLILESSICAYADSADLLTMLAEQTLETDRLRAQLSVTKSALAAHIQGCGDVRAVLGISDTTGIIQAIEALKAHLAASVAAQDGIREGYRQATEETGKKLAAVTAELDALKYTVVMCCKCGDRIYGDDEHAALITERDQIRAEVEKLQYQFANEINKLVQASWSALGDPNFSGLSIPEHIQKLKSDRDAAVARAEKAELELATVRKELIPASWQYLDACPNCGCDVVAPAESTDEVGNKLFTDGDDARCGGCGMPGQVTCDSETPACFTAFDRTWEVNKLTGTLAAAESRERALREGFVRLIEDYQARWDDMRDCVLHGIDGLDNDQTNSVLSLIDDLCPTDIASVGKALAATAHKEGSNMEDEYGHGYISDDRAQQGAKP